MRRDILSVGLRAVIGAAILLACGYGNRLPAQASIQDVTFCPFVIGFRPVVSNGAVGGVLIDARGVVARASPEAQDRLRAARDKALREVPAELDRPSQLRKVSLRGLEQAITELRAKKQEVTDEVQNLAGLQRIRYVFVDREHRDIILAGPAEGWKVGPQGAIVGRKSGAPTLQLDDLVFALRTAEAAKDEAISCSIDPTPEGVQRFTRLSKSLGGGVSEATLRRLEEAVGPQQVTIRGVPADSRFARVMVAADVLMKRLALGFERPPVSGLPNYLELVSRGDGMPRDAMPRDAMPRWWLAPKYDPLLRDAEGLAWELRGSGVQAMTEDTRFGADGAAKRTGKANPVAVRWAAAFSDKYAELSGELPIFGELRNCIDLAVVAALIVKHELPRQARYGFPLLMSGGDIKPASLDVPKTVPSQANTVRKAGQWIVTVSGGVEINSWAAAEKIEARADLSESRRGATAKLPRRWWWD